MALPLTEVLADPAAAAEHLRHDGAVFGVELASGRRGAGAAAVLELSLAPVPALASVGYPHERVRLVIPVVGAPLAFPLGDPKRPFCHRNGFPLRDLCLQYDRDAAALRWLPADGLEPLVTLVHRHLMFEEAWRRSGQWPCEDAPHGAEAAAHPIRSAHMREQANRWSRP